MKNAQIETRVFAPSPWLHEQVLVTDSDMDAQLTVLGPSAEKEMPKLDRRSVLYVVAGEVTVKVHDANYILRTDGLLPIPADRSFLLRNHAESPAKVFVLRLPAPRVEWRLFELGVPATSK